MFVRNQSGQTIIAIFAVMLLALGIGLSISTRFLRGLGGTVDVDYSARALAIAEAAIERILLIPHDTIEEYIQFGSCGSDCALSITGADGVVATANVTLSQINSQTDHLPVNLETTKVIEISLDGYPDSTDVSVCWNGSGSLPSVTGTYVYGTSGDYDMDNFAYNSVGSTQSNGFSTAAPNFGYSDCFTVSGQDDPILLRLRSVYSTISAFVVPASGQSLPSQGIQVESVGTVKDINRKVTVIVSEPLLPIPFDYVLYQKSQTQPLSN